MFILRFDFKPKNGPAVYDFIPFIVRSAYTISETDIGLNVFSDAGITPVAIPEDFTSYNIGASSTNTLTTDYNLRYGLFSEF